MTFTDHAIRWGAAVAVVFVAAIAAVISYQHAYALVLANGEAGLTAKALPLTVDGLIATCSLVLLDAARRGVPAPVMAWLLLTAGITATLGANVSHGLAHGPVGAIVAAWPAAVTVGAFELLTRLIRSGRTGFASIDEPPVAQETEADLPQFLSASEAALEPVATPALGAGQVLATGHALAYEPQGTGAETTPNLEAVPAPSESALEPVATPAPEPVPTDAINTTPPDVWPNPDPVVVTARERFADVLATGALPSVRSLRKELGIGHPRAKAVLAALTESAA